jgi:hypothetical protein
MGMTFLSVRPPVLFVKLLNRVCLHPIDGVYNKSCPENLISVRMDSVSITYTLHEAKLS